APNGPTASAPATSPARWGPGPYVVRFVTLLVKGPKPIKPPPPSPISEEIEQGSAILQPGVPSVTIERPGGQPGDHAAATDLDVNQILAMWKRRYPAYQVDLLTAGKVACQNGHYCTVDLRPVTRGKVTVSATDNFKIEETGGRMTVIRRGGIQLVEPSKSDAGGP